MAAGHNITIIPANRHIEVRVGGQKLAGSDRAMRLDETGLPTRYYIPREDVRTDLLRPAAHKTTCPFKGQASYWSAQVGGELYKNLVWSYETPIPAAAQIAGLMCFYNERVELTIGDEHQQMRMLVPESGWATKPPQAGVLGQIRHAGHGFLRMKDSPCRISP